MEAHFAAMAGGSTGFRLLLVDDEPAVLALLSRFVRLRHPDWDVVTAPDGLEAYQLLRGGGFDLVLTDLCMPRMDGFELWARVAEEQPRIAIAFMSGHCDYIAKARVLGSGVVFALEKPMECSTVMARLEEFELEMRTSRMAENRSCDVVPGRESTSEDKGVLGSAAESGEAGFSGSGESSPIPELRGINAVRREELERRLYPYIMGGLLHNAMNTLGAMQWAVELLEGPSATRERGSEAQLVHLLGVSCARLVPVLRLMQRTTRAYYREERSQSLVETLATMEKSFREQYPGIRFGLATGAGLDQSPVPSGALAFMVEELAHNAARACAGVEAPSIQVRADYNPDRGEVEICCEDDGCGFPEAILRQIDAQQVMAPAGGATHGFGLYLISEIVLRLHGGLLAGNREPRGASVRLILPSRLTE